MRILIVGTAGSGKTTLGTHLSRLLGIPFFELDTLFWGPDWTPPDRTVFRASVEELLKGKQDWVVDGNYRSVRDLLVDAADIVIWLDYSLWICQWRLARRTATRILRHERLFHGNRESLRELVRTRFEFFRWAASEHRRLRSEMSEIERDGSPPLVIRIQHRRDLESLRRMIASADSPIHSSRNPAIPDRSSEKEGQRANG